MGRVQWIVQISNEHDLKINPKQFIITPLYTWLRNNPAEYEYELFRRMQSVRSSYPLQANLRAPYLFFAKGAPALLGWLLWEKQQVVYAGGDRHPGAAWLTNFLAVQNDPSVLKQQGEVNKEEIEPK